MQLAVLKAAQQWQRREAGGVQAAVLRVCMAYMNPEAASDAEFLTNKEWGRPRKRKKPWMPLVPVGVPMCLLLRSQLNIKQAHVPHASCWLFPEIYDSHTDAQPRGDKLQCTKSHAPAACYCCIGSRPHLTDPGAIPLR